MGPSNLTDVGHCPRLRYAPPRSAFRNKEFNMRHRISRQRVCGGAVRNLAMGLLLLAGVLGCKNTASSVSVPLELMPGSGANLNTVSGTLGQTKVHVAPVDDKRANKE